MTDLKANMEALEDRARFIQRRLAARDIPMSIKVEVAPNGIPKVNVEISSVLFILMAELVLDALDCGTIQPIVAPEPNPLGVIQLPPDGPEAN